jgi:hypothetical protein
LFSLGTIISKNVDDSAQSRQTLVNGGAFLGPVTSGSCSIKTLGTSQIDDIVFAIQLLAASLFRVVNCEDSMTSGRVLIHFSSADDSERFTEIKKLFHLLIRLAQFGHQFDRCFSVGTFGVKLDVSFCQGFHFHFVIF